MLNLFLSCVVAIDKSSYENNTNAHLLTVTEGTCIGYMLLIVHCLCIRMCLPAEQDESQSVSRSQNMGSNYEGTYMKQYE